MCAVTFSFQHCKGFGDMPQLRSSETEHSTFSEKKLQLMLSEMCAVSAVKVADFAQKCSGAKCSVLQADSGRAKQILGKLYLFCTNEVVFPKKRLLI